MFAKKYKPSVDNNNALKDNVVKELKVLIYKLEKGRFDDSLNAETISDIAAQLKKSMESLDNTIGTGDENISRVADETEKLIKELKKQVDQQLTNRIEGVTDELIFNLTLWKDILDGLTPVDTDSELKKAKVSWTRRKLNDKLAQLDEIKTSFVSNDRRLEKELTQEEKDLAEYENQMLAEDNERKLNDLYRKIKASKSKIDMLTVRKSNYSACYNLLDMIYANAKEILSATDFAAEEIAKAKVLLNINKLKAVVSEPDKAVAILKRMDKEVKDIAVKTKTLDEKVFGLDQGSAQIDPDALKFKEELMRKKREKEGLKDDLNSEKLGINAETKNTITEEN